MLSKRLALVIAAFTLGGCEQVTDPLSPEVMWNRIPLDERVTDAYADFGFELFRQLRAEIPGGNLFVSPTGAAIALSMTYSGAVGQTADEMADALGIEGLEPSLVHETNRLWLNALRQTGDPRAELSVANSVWHRESFKLLDAFRVNVETFYDAELGPLTTADAINAWVDQATRGRIDEIINGDIPSHVAAYLINALYFKADWTYQFDRSNTRNVPFTRADGVRVQVPMMFQTADVEIRRDPDARMLRLPYGAGRFSMVLALPEPGADLETIATKLGSVRWKQWMGEFVESPGTEIGIPRFEMEWESSLVGPLQQMGMEVAFTPDADFSAMFESSRPWIGEVLQKTYLKVDEEGTEAAAVTSVAMITSCCSNPRIVFDRPFLLAIYDHATKTVLFLGQITDPSG